MIHRHGKSTGPTSPEGKSESSKNSTAHGMRSNVVRLLPGESQEEMDAMRAMWHSQYGKYLEGNEGLASLLNTLMDTDWVQKRAMRLNSEVVAQLVEAEAAGEDEEWITKLEKKLLLWTRYKTSAENSFRGALRAIEQFLGRRRRESMQQQKIVIDICDKGDAIASRKVKDGRIAPAAAPTTDDAKGGGHEERTGTN